MAYRKYSQQFKNRALEVLFLVNGGNVHKTATDLGIPYSTLYGWAEDAEGHEDLGEQSKIVVQRILESMPEQFSEHSWHNSLREAVKAYQILKGAGGDEAQKAEMKPAREQAEEWAEEMDAEAMAGAFFRKVGYSPSGKQDPIQALLQAGKENKEKEESPERDKEREIERELKKLMAGNVR